MHIPTCSVCNGWSEGRSISEVMSCLTPTESRSLSVKHPFFCVHRCRPFIPFRRYSSPFLRSHSHMKAMWAYAKHKIKTYACRMRVYAFAMRVRTHTKLLNGPRLFYMFYIANIKPIYRCRSQRHRPTPSHALPSPYRKTRRNESRTRCWLSKIRTRTGIL